ncbi:MAG: MaoC family dehydratase [Lachnospiraceae bacterium]|nr:MaoC family dehydratase [Lachnospiraceae bacterium]
MNHYSFEELTVGQEESFEADITEEMMEQFYRITGDENPLHRDSAFAGQMGYADRVVYGMLTSSFFSTLAGVYLPGERSLIHRVETEFPRPVFIGDHLTVTGKVQERNETFQTVTLKVVITNQNKEKVCRGKMRIGFLKRDGE